MALSQQVIPRGELVLAVSGVEQFFEWQNRTKGSEDRQLTLNIEEGRKAALKELAIKLGVMDELKERRRKAEDPVYVDLSKVQRLEREEVNLDAIITVIDDQSKVYQAEYDAAEKAGSISGIERAEGKIYLVACVKNSVQKRTLG